MLTASPGHEHAGAEAEDRPDGPDDDRLEEAEPSTWRREAPIARSRADSRVRWATRIEKVCEDARTPTTSEGDRRRRSSRPVVIEAEEVALDVVLLLGGEVGAADRLGARSGSAVGRGRLTELVPG